MARLPRSTFELLFRAARLVNERAVDEMQRAGATTLRISHTALLPHISDAGVRQTELADKLGVTKQAVGPLVDDLVGGGIVERIADPTDARAKLVRWTAKGRRALHHGIGVLAKLEGELAADVGTKRLAALADTLEALIAAVERA
jgi:DNA-binding MarR family transcriptional regulator